MSRRSRTSRTGLLARQFRADLGPLFALAAVVLVVATLASVSPLAVRSMTSAEVAYQFENLPAVRRDLISRAPGSPPITPGASPFARFDSSLANITASAPDPLRKSLGTANYVVSTGSLQVLRPNVGPKDPETPITLNTSSGLVGHIRMTAGSLPAPFDTIVRPDNPDESLVNALTNDPAGPQIDVVMSTKSAAESQWKIGDVRTVMASPKQAFAAKLSGTFDAIDPADGFWAVARSTLQPGISYTAFSGSNTRIVTSAAFIDPGSWPVMTKQTGLSVSTSAGIPLSTAGLTVEEDEDLLPQLRRFTAQQQQITPVASSGTITTLTFVSDAEDTLTTALSRASIAASVLVMVASGPIGVAIAALWLLSRLIVLRRRHAMTLASARGASGSQLRLAPALEVLVLTVPVAAIGVVAALLVFPRSWTPVSVIIAGLVALVPPILIAVATSPRSLRISRGDVNPRARGRYRWVLEIIVLVLTALAVTLLLQRGLTTNSNTVAVDPLLAATPLLLAVSAGLIVLRIYPLPLLAFARLAKRRKGIVGFLGAHRSIRDPAVGLAPVLAMVVGLAVAVFSGVLLGTTAGGIDTAAHSRVGADLRIDSPILTAEQIKEIAATAGVAESVALYQDNHLVNLTLTDHHSAVVNISVPIILVDTAALARVQEGVPGTASFTSTMSTMVKDHIPVLLSPSLATQYSITTNSTFGQVGIVRGGNPGTSPALSGVQDWALVDVANTSSFDISKFLPRITLIRLAPGADIDAVRSELSRIVGADATLQSPADVTHVVNSSPISGGLQLALIALIVIVALLCAAAVVLALIISAPARERLLALLRTLGVTQRQSRGITAWEIVPTATVAIIVGMALGAALPFIVLAGVDLRPFTGGVLQPTVLLNPALMGIIIGGFAVLVIAATAIAMAAARRVNLARTLRTSEEG